MKAAVMHSFGSPLVIQTLPDPQPGAGEIVVDVIATRVLPYMNEVISGARQYSLNLPLAPGVGAIGRVRSIGPDATRIAPGDWVFCDPTVRSRDDADSPDIMLQGLTAPSEGAQRLQAHFRHGSFAERMLMPLENAVRLGELDEAQAARWCALSTLLVPYGGLLAAGLQPGQTALISGATGNFGSAGVAVALAMGASRVVAPGRNRAALAALEHRFGSRIVTVALGEDDSENTARMRAAAGAPIDVVLDLLPPLPDSRAVRAAAMAVRAHGTVVLMGGLRVGLELPYDHLMRNCITVRGQFMYPRNAPARLAALIRSGMLSLDHFEPVRFALDDIDAAIAHAADNSGPFRLTVVTPSSIAST